VPQEDSLERGVYALLLEWYEQLRDQDDDDLPTGINLTTPIGLYCMETVSGLLQNGIDDRRHFYDELVLFQRWLDAIRQLHDRVLHDTDIQTLSSLWSDISDKFGPDNPPPDLAVPEV
jgi:hypothetical protein